MNPRYTNTIQTPDKNDFFPALIKIFNGRFFPYIFFLAVIFIVYAGSVMFGVTELDDVALVVLRKEYLQDPYNIISSFFKSVFNESADTFYRPVLVISWITDTLAGGGRLWVYHLADVIYHFIAVCLLFNLLKAFNVSRAKAFIFSSFFAVLPVFNQAVSWIPGRNDTLLTIFVLSSFIFIVKYSFSGKTGHLLTGAFLFAAALFTKETAVAAFIVFPAYALLYGKNPLSRRTIILILALALCGLLWFSMKAAFTGSGEINIYHLVNYIKGASLKFFPATLQYISKIFFPVNLKVMPDISIFDVLSGFVIAACIGIMVGKSKEVNYTNVIFGMIWFVSFLALPYLQNSPLMLEHRTYPAAFGLILILNEIKPAGSVKSVLPFLLFLYFIFFTAVSFINNTKFKNELNFAAAAITENPGSVKTAFLYGRRFLDNGTFQTGGYFMKKNFEKLSVGEKRKEIPNNAFLGIFAWQRGDIKEAKKYLTMAAERGTSIHQTYAALADIYLNEGRYEEALANMKKAFKLKPENPEYFRYLKLSFDKVNNKKQQ